MSSGCIYACTHRQHLLRVIDELDAENRTLLDELMVLRDNAAQGGDQRNVQPSSATDPEVRSTSCPWFVPPLCSVVACWKRGVESVSSSVVCGHLLVLFLRRTRASRSI